MVTEANWSRPAIMVTLDVALAVRPLRPLGGSSVRLAVTALLGADLARRTWLGPWLLRPGMPVAARLARTFVTRLAMLTRLITSFDPVDLLDPLSMPLAVVARFAVAIGTLRCTVEAEPAAALAASRTIAGALGKRTAASAAPAPPLTR